MFDPELYPDSSTDLRLSGITRPLFQQLSIVRTVYSKILLLPGHPPDIFVCACHLHDEIICVLCGDWLCFSHGADGDEYQI